MKPAPFAVLAVVLATAMVWPLSSAIASANARAAARQGLAPAACTQGDRLVLPDGDDGDDDDDGDDALPPGHPPLGFQLPPGHPPLGMEGLPPGHPQVGGRLPPGHPPVSSGHGPALPLPAEFGAQGLLSI